jgi:betaine-aldehyde dehydrogenase
MPKLFQTELGGKTPMIVFDDADLEAAAPKVKALTVFAGQFCITGGLSLASPAGSRRQDAAVDD